jgi:hypothetical protein
MKNIATLSSTIWLAGEQLTIELAFERGLLAPVRIPVGTQTTRYGAKVVDDPQRGYLIDQSTFNVLTHWQTEREQVTAAQTLLAQPESHRPPTLSDERSIWPHFVAGAILERIPAPNHFNPKSFSVLITNRGTTVANGVSIDVPWTKARRTMRYERFRIRDVRVIDATTFAMLKEGAEIVRYRFIHVPEAVSVENVA